MPNLSFDFQGRKDLIDDVPMPPGLHNKIMKRVFILNYRKHLLASTVILFVNLTALSFELYRKMRAINFTEISQVFNQNFVFSTDYLRSSVGTLYQTLPMGSIITTSVVAALCIYMTALMVKLYTNQQITGLIRNFVK